MDIRIPTLVMTLSMPLVAVAEQHANAQAENSQPSPEEILITGYQTLRIKLMDTEKKAYDTFNKFNDEKRFNISCSIGKPSGTHFEKQVCQPEFEIEATSAHAQDYLDGLRNFLNPVLGTVPDGSVAPAHAPMETEIARQLPDYKRKIKEVAEKHPEFLQAIIEYSKVRQQYEAATITAGK